MAILLAAPSVIMGCILVFHIWTDIRFMRLVDQRLRALETDDKEKP